MSWQDDNTWESNWWGNCVNTYWEETKQRIYASKMGLKADMLNGKYPTFDLQNKTVLDIGGGPVSLLLKCLNLKYGVVVDPCKYPDWIAERYKLNNIEYVIKPAEDYEFSPGVQTNYDEVWIYNVLQHTMDPAKIIANARKVAKVIRIFEWVDTYIAPGHPHVLTEEKLNEWLGGEGKVEELNESGCNGKAYYGIFKGAWYE